MCKYNLYHFLHHHIYWESSQVAHVLRERFYQLSAVTYDNSRLIFCTGKVNCIYKYTAQVMDIYSMLGLDSHADISCAGRDAHILAQREGKACTVRPFNDNYDPMMNIDIVDVAYKYESIEGDEYILEVCRRAYIPRTK